MGKLKQVAAILGGALAVVVGAGVAAELGPRPGPDPSWRDSVAVLMPAFFVVASVAAGAGVGLLVVWWKGRK